MDAGGTCLARTLPIDAALAGDVLVRLRRDTPGGVARWSLGRRGSAELDANFCPVITATAAPPPAWTTSARLWDRDGIAVAHMVVELTGRSADACELTVRPTEPLTPYWQARISELRDLVEALGTELAEELLWHATRDGVTSGTD